MSLASITLAASLPWLSTGFNVEFESIVRSETRTGLEPSSNNPAGTVPIIDLELVPAAEMSILASDVALALRYRPRVFYRWQANPPLGATCTSNDQCGTGGSCSIPNGQSQGTCNYAPVGALLLHQFEALWRWRQSQDVRWNVSAYVARGDVSYGRLVEGGDQATSGASTPSTIPVDLVVHSFNMTLLGNVTTRFAPTDAMNTEFRAQLTEARTNINAPPDTYLIYVSPTYVHNLNRTDDLEIGATLQDVGFVRVGDSNIRSCSTDADCVNGQSCIIQSGQMQGVCTTACPTDSNIKATPLPDHLDLPTLEARIGWRRRFTTSFNTVLHVGYDALLNDPGQSTPIFDATANGTFYSDTSTRFTGSLSVGVQGFANPIFEAFGPRAFVSGYLNLISNPHLTAALTASLYTPLRGRAPNHFDPSKPGCPLSQQSIITARIPVIYTFNDEFQLEVGARLAERASNIDEPTPTDGGPAFRFTYLELLAYAAFTVTFGRGAEAPSVTAGR